jgi:hypothetical protein
VLGSLSVLRQLKPGHASPQRSQRRTFSVLSALFAYIQRAAQDGVLYGKTWVITNRSGLTTTLRTIKFDVVVLPTDLDTRGCERRFKFADVVFVMDDI